MDALVQLRRIARALAKARLEAIMLGNAAAALQGAPVTTLDFDFYYRRTPENVRKLKEITRELGGVLFAPFYPVSTMMRLEVDVPPLQVDFLSSASGVSSFASLRSRAIEFRIDQEHTLRLANLTDIIKSKSAARRPKDLAVLPILKATLEEVSRNEAPQPQPQPRSAPRARARRRRSRA